MMPGPSFYVIEHAIHKSQAIAYEKVALTSEEEDSRFRVPAVKSIDK